MVPGTKVAHFFHLMLEVVFHYLRSLLFLFLLSLHCLSSKAQGVTLMSFSLVQSRWCLW